MATKTKNVSKKARTTKKATKTVARKKATKKAGADTKATMGRTSKKPAGTAKAGKGPKKYGEDHITMLCSMMTNPTTHRRSFSGMDCTVNSDIAVIAANILCEIRVPNRRLPKVRRAWKAAMSSFGPDNRDGYDFGVFQALRALAKRLDMETE